MTEAEKVMRATIEQNDYVKTLGIEFLEMREGYAKGRMKCASLLQNPYGAMHGGCLYSLADIVSGVAACMRGNYVVTVCGSMNYLSPATNTEYVYCEAFEERSGRELAVFHVKLTKDTGEVVETGSFTFYQLNQKVVEDDIKQKKC